MNEITSFLLDEREYLLNKLKEGFDPKLAQEAAWVSQILCGLDAYPLDGEQPVAKKAAVANGETEFVNMILDELAGAEKYWNLHTATRDDRYRQMSKAEISHAAALYAIAKEQGQEVKDLEQRRIQLERIIR